MNKGESLSPGVKTEARVSVASAALIIALKDKTDAIVNMELSLTIHHT